MNMKAVKFTVIWAAAIAAGAAQASNAPAPRWYVTGSLGYSLLGDPSATYTPSSGPASRGKLKLGGGLMTGGGVGWYLRPDVRLEADYTYRSDELRSTTVPGLSTQQNDADYASVIITANLMKDFEGWRTARARFKPYVGAGIGVAQEIDTDLTLGGSRREFSGNRAAWQLLAGVQWQYQSPWFAGVGVKYVNAGTPRLKGTSAGTGDLQATYEGLGVDLRLGYRF
jgi:opacity protein-like surface antigen